MATKLIFAVLHVGTGTATIDAVVEDGGGHRRKIRYTLLAKEPTDVPQEGWFKSIIGEVEFRQASEADEAAGRVLKNY
jgi:hypothetical protein